MGTSWHASPVMITKMITTSVTNLTASPHARMHHTDCRDSVMKTKMKTAHQSQTRIREMFSGAYSNRASTIAKTQSCRSRAHITCR